MAFILIMILEFYSLFYLTIIAKEFFSVVETAEKKSLFKELYLHWSK